MSFTLRVRTGVTHPGIGRASRWRLSQAQELLKLSIPELEDAIEVLGCGDLHPDAVMKLKEALVIDLLALATSHKPTRNSLIDQAINRKVQARSIMKN